MITVPERVMVDIEKEGEKHHALDDARHQARVASEALARLDGVVVDV